MTHSRCADGDTTDRYEWDSLTHPWVRDLAWLLHAPDLVATAYAGRPTLAELGLENSACRQAWLRELDMAPERLEPYLGECPRRLGLYHERLWHALLDLAPATRLLATNLVLHAHGRTLGELDLLYVDAQGRPVHLELAIKYYLGLRDGPGDARDPARWIGTTIRARPWRSKYSTKIACPHLRRVCNTYIQTHTCVCMCMDVCVRVSVTYIHT